MIVVVGLFHSGTSLLTGILGAIGVRLGDGLNKFNEPEALAALLRQWWDEPALRATVPQGERVAALRTWAATSGADAVKHPLLTLAWRDCRAAWPGCRFVATDRPLEQSLFAVNAEYQATQRKLWAAKARVPVELSIRFGDLLASPAEQIGRLAGGLGLQPTESQVRAAAALIRPRPEEPAGFTASA